MNVRTCAGSSRNELRTSVFALLLGKRQKHFQRSAVR